MFTINLDLGCFGRGEQVFFFLLRQGSEEAPPCAIKSQDCLILLIEINITITLLGKIIHHYTTIILVYYYATPLELQNQRTLGDEDQIYNHTILLYYYTITIILYSYTPILRYCDTTILLASSCSISAHSAMRISWPGRRNATPRAASIAWCEQGVHGMRCE